MKKIWLFALLVLVSGVAAIGTVRAASKDSAPKVAPAVQCGADCPMKGNCTDANCPMHKAGKCGGCGGGASCGQ